MQKSTSVARWLHHLTASRRAWAFRVALMGGIVCAYVWLHSAVGDAAFAILSLLLLAVFATASKLGRIRNASAGANRPAHIDTRTHLLGFTLHDRADM
jgi:hypothetical protein